ncbi:MAG: nucleotide-binding protein [Candidatus Bathyarchaeia archaeon]
MTRPYVVPEPPELTHQIDEIVARIQPLWNERNFAAAEQLFREYYETMRQYEERLPEGRRFHKGTPLHNWGISILLQEDVARIREALRKIFLAYIEDLLDFDNLQQVHSAPAYKTLKTSPLLPETFDSAEARVEELRTAGRIPKNPEDVLTPQLRMEIQPGLPQVNTRKLKTVFVVHGRNREARDSMFLFLKSLGLNPINLSETIVQSGQVTPYIGQALDYAFSLAQAVVVLMTPDDIGCLRRAFRKTNDMSHDTKFTPQARLNVIFEAGMAMGGDFRKRTILVELGQLRQLTDLSGLLMVRLDNTPEKRQDLIARLRNCGCIVDDSGGRWLREGDFEKALIQKENFFERFVLSHL